MMQMSKTVIIAASVAGLLVGTANVFADGKALFTEKLCVTCHGEEGKAPIMPGYPKLAGQDQTYCEAQVKDIRGGVRTNGSSAAMMGTIATVTDAEITEICGYLASE